MKQFFKNIAASADNGSLFVLLSVMFVSVVFAIFGVAVTIIALFNFPQIALPAILLICMIRIIYAGVTGK